MYNYYSYFFFFVSSYGSCGPVDQSLDVPYVQEDELEPSCQEQDFYPPPPPVPLCASQPAACSCSDAHDPPPPPMHTHLPLCDPHRFLFGMSNCKTFSWKLIQCCTESSGSVVIMYILPYTLLQVWRTGCVRRSMWRSRTLEPPYRR